MMNEAFAQAKETVEDLTACLDERRRGFGRNAGIFRRASSDDNRAKTCVNAVEDALNGCISSWRFSLFEAADDASELVGKLMISAHEHRRDVVLVMSPMFTPELLTDGFYRRVHAIDELFAPDSLRVFAGASMDERVRVSIVDDNHISIRGPLWDDEIARHLAPIVKHADIVCCESAYNILPDVLEGFSGRMIYDFHGAVPEEEEQKGNLAIMPTIHKREHFGVTNSDAIVVVSRIMERHIVEKYPECQSDFIYMPIFDDSVLKACIADLTESQRKQHDVPVAVYAGGLQVWQMIDEMQDAIEKCGNACSYTIFTPNPGEFWNLWGNRARPDSMEVRSVPAEHVVAEYDQCDYGFILREDIVVNRVACPTKLVEYCACGLVPVVNSTNIGDFAERGVESVSIEDFVLGKLPDDKEYARIVEVNKRVAKEMAQEFEEGRHKLEQLFRGN